MKKAVKSGDIGDWVMDEVKKDLRSNTTENHKVEKVNVPNSAR
jgi:hypothetical protein